MDDALKKDIALELESLERLIREMQDLLDRAIEESDFVVARAAGSIIHDFYCGVEKVFERIAINFDKVLPKGEDWHIKLLFQMAEAKKDRKEIIDPPLLQSLKEYLRFRHLFRNIYGFELKWEKIQPLGTQLDDIYRRLKKCLGEFLK